MCTATKSTRKTCLSDEPFTIRDIQFNNPQVRVSKLPASQILTEFLFIFSILNACAGPVSRSCRIRNPLKKAGIPAPFSQNDNNRAGVAFTFVKDRRETARRTDRPDQARHLEVSGNARDYAASFSIELESSA